MENEVPKHLRFVVDDAKRGNLLVPKKLEGRDDAEYLAQVIRDNPRLHRFVMEWDDRGKDECEPLFEALAECKALKSLRLNGNWLSDKQAPAVAAIIRNNPYLEDFAVADTGLTNKGVGIIAEALKEREYLQRADFSTNNLGNDGAEHLAQLITSCPELLELKAADCSIGDRGVKAIAEAMRGNTTLASLQLGQNFCSPPASEFLAGVILETASPNFITTGMPHANQDVTELCRTNRVHMQKAGEKLEEVYRFVEGRYEEVELQDELDTLDASDIAFIRRHYSAVVQQDDVPEAAEAFRDMLDSLPEAGKGEALTLESLTQKRYEFSNCVLDNPRTWENMPAIATELAEKGTPLSHEMLSQRSRTGEDFLTVGFIYAPEATMEALNLSGIRITSNDLLTPDTREPSKLCKTLIREGMLGAVFSYDNWQGCNPAELRATYQALPEEGKAQVQGYHSLTAALSQDVQSMQRGR